MKLVVALFKEIQFFMLFNLKTWGTYYIWDHTWINTKTSIRVQNMEMKRLTELPETEQIMIET